MDKPVRMKQPRKDVLRTQLAMSANAQMYAAMERDALKYEVSRLIEECAKVRDRCVARGKAATRRAVLRCGLGAFALGGLIGWAVAHV